MVDNNKLNVLLWCRQMLHKVEDRGEISKKDYEEKLAVLDVEIKPLQHSLVDSLVSTNLEGKKMIEDIVTKPVVEKPAKVPVVKMEKAPRRYKEGTLAGMVLKALQMKSVRSLDKAVETVKGWKPEVDKKFLETYIKIIIKATKDGKGRWKNFTWDAENFTLIPK